MPLKHPAGALYGQLANVDARIRAVTGNNPAEYVQAEMAVAQVQALCALVHAVRELTGEVRQLREGT